MDPTRQQPTYFVEATEKGWDDDVCLIRFHAGPPYEDIAFKIVNKKWEYSSRRCGESLVQQVIVQIQPDIKNK